VDQRHAFELLVEHLDSGGTLENFTQGPASPYAPVEGKFVQQAIERIRMKKRLREEKQAGANS
jgi:hypothetical protein